MRCKLTIKTWKMLFTDPVYQRSNTAEMLSPQHQSQAKLHLIPQSFHPLEKGFGLFFLPYTSQCLHKALPLPGRAFDLDLIEDLDKLFSCFFTLTGQT